MASSFRKKILWILACLCLATSTVGLWWLDLPVAHALSPYQLEEKRLPPAIDYEQIGGLRLEAREKLARIRPLNLGQAERISGVNPADIAVLMVYLTLKEHK